MFGPRTAMLGGIAGAVVGAAVAVALVLGGALDDRTTQPPPADASAEFLAAYQRSLEGTYAVRADFTRRLDSGATLTSTALVAQRPPDSIRRQFGGISGTIQGHVVACATEVDGTFHCSPAADAPSFDETVQQSMQTMTSYFTETPALYRAVRDGDDCFLLIQNRPSAVLPYGSEARFCFDAATGAISFLRENKEGAVDTFEATDIRGSVTTQDFSLSQDDDFAAHTESAPSSSVDDTTPTSDPGATTSTVPDRAADTSTSTSSTVSVGGPATSEGAAG